MYCLSCSDNPLLTPKVARPGKYNMLTGETEPSVFSLGILHFFPTLLARIGRTCYLLHQWLAYLLFGNYPSKDYLNKNHAFINYIQVRPHVCHCHTQHSAHFAREMARIPGCLLTFMWIGSNTTSHSRWLNHGRGLTSILTRQHWGTFQHLWGHQS